MVSSVSGASTPTATNKIGAMDKVSQQQLYNPGAYSIEQLLAPPPPYKKKGGFFKFLGKLILTAAVVGGALVGAKKLIPALKNAPKELAEGAKMGEKAKYYIAKAGDWVEKTAKDLVAKIKKIAKKEGAEGTDATKAAGETPPPKPPETGANVDVKT